MNVLITGGGCREPVDGVRCITNMSTGKTAALIADRFISGGAGVTALMAVQSQLPESALQEENRRPADGGQIYGDGRAAGNSRLRLFRYETGGELAGLMERELTSRAYDAVIHAAAVSDFRPAVITVNGASFPAGRTAGKIPSGSQLSVTFEPAPKIAPRLRMWAAAGNTSGGTVIICFKLTDGADPMERLRASAVLFGDNAADYVVSNDLTEMENSSHPFELFGKPESTETLPYRISSGKTAEELAQALYMILSAEQVRRPGAGIPDVR